MRHICYVTGNRADFGLIRSTLQKIDSHPQLKLSIAMTGMHLIAKYGSTKQDVVNAGFNTYIVDSKEDSTQLSMAVSVGEQISGFSKLFSSLHPSIVLVLGDRGEMLAASIAALYLNIPVAHIHGGELSGTVDECIRHAISKLSHFHFVATQKSQQRLVRMGEKAANVMVTGAPGLDDIINVQIPAKTNLCDELVINPNGYILTVIFHPIVQDAELAGGQMEEVLSALPEDYQIVILMPNADAGAGLIRDKISEYSLARKNVTTAAHISRNLYLSLLAHSDVLIGNSSSGIIEAASFGTWVINIGGRQANRERNANTIDVEVEGIAIKRLINYVLTTTKLKPNNVYGDGQTGARITDLLLTVEINDETTKKCNSY